MENQRIKRSRGIEVNTMTILDASGFKKDTQDLIDDRLAFIEAVRSASIAPENGIAPTKKMCEAIFEILKEDNSLELIMASYRLLTELDKHFPRVYASKLEKSEIPSPSSVPELVVVEEAWSPFISGSDSEREDANKNSGSLDFAGFEILIQDLAKAAVGRKMEEFETKYLRNMVLLQYLISVLEGDFVPRNSVFKENMDWNLLRVSLLNTILGSRRISYKDLIKGCLSIICEMSHLHAEHSDYMTLPKSSSAELFKSLDTAGAISFPEVRKCLLRALQKFLLMAMELDTSRKKADIQGLTTRADGVRTPVVEIIQDELTYNRDAISPFFQVFNEPQWKMEILLQYFQKYIAKPSVLTRRSSEPIEDATFDGVLKCFSNINSVKSIIKKISIEVAQLLLAHTFQAGGNFAFWKRSIVYSSNHPVN
ncbi:negative regulator of systemic acquired resistance SNI1 isoform X2 [Rhododendron vialii]|uniref:negative regulator of systemic acquired resistance SNI1 isoform X2 n=1 Tax=Rhododendron vialii TaxID=182163 RepID=UPI00265E0CBF|nr:negative regulator of systemic acquired resistance SNI1 isoform X2 [Rhododendron vialii]